MPSVVEPVLLPVEATSRPRVWASVPNGVLLGGFLVLLLLFFPDKRTDELLTRLSWLLLAVAAVTDREGPLAGRFRVLAVLYPASLVLAAGPALVHSGSASGVRYFVRYQDWLLWLAVLWLATPLLLQSIRREAGRHFGVAAMTALLLLFDLLVMVSGFSSPESKVAMKRLGAEALPYTGIFLLLIRVAGTEGRARDLARRGALGVVAAVLGAMLLVVAVHAAGGPAAEWLRAHEWIRVEPDPAAPKRLQFPFEHHNRAGYFAPCPLFVGLASAAATRSRTGRLAGLGTAVMALAVLPFPMTRGAILAAVAGSGVMAGGILLLRRRRLPRALWVLPLLFPLLWFVLPDAHRKHIRSTFTSRTVDPHATNTVVSRFTLWRYTAEMIGERPWLGFGYGSENFEATLKQKHPAEMKALDGSSHAHNLWLEIAAETGLPAAAVFLVFTLCRFGVLVRAWAAARRMSSALTLPLMVWIGLEVAVQVYALTNHPLRRNIGFFTWALWAVGVAMAVAVYQNSRDVVAEGHGEPRG